MSFKTIRHASQQIWPSVAESLDIHRKQRATVKADPRGATTSAKARADRPWNRVVSEETVWALAKADLLLDEEQQAVLKAAKEWARSWEDGPPTLREDNLEDVELYSAVQALASAIDADDLDTAAVG